MTASRRRPTFTTFHLGDLLLGLPSNQVREVMKNPRITPVPLVSPALLGVFNARGELVTVIDLRRRLGLPEREGQATTHIIVPTADGTVSLLVDREGDVVETDPDSFEPAPGGLDAAARACVTGAYKLPKRLLIVLDTAKTLDVGDGAAAPEANQMAGGSAT